MEAMELSYMQGVWPLGQAANISRDAETEAGCHEARSELGKMPLSIANPSGSLKNDAQ